MIFDARTGFLFLSLLCLVISLALWTVLFRQRTRALDLWCGAGLLASGATLLFALRPFLPEVLGYTLAALLAFLMLVLKLHAIRLELGQTESIRNQVILVVAFLTGYEFLRLGFGETSCYFVASVSILLMNARVAWWAWLLAERPGHRRARWIAASFALMAAMYGLRLVNAGLGIFDARLITQGYDALLLALAALVGMIVSNIAWLGLALERLVQAQVAQLEHQRILALLSASLGDELTQPLTAVLTNAQVARRALGDESQDTVRAIDFLDKIVDSTRRASRIIENIRGFIRPAQAQREPVDLTRLMREVGELVAAEARVRHATVDLLLPERPLRVIGNPIQLWQLALNLLRNAVVVGSGEKQLETQVRLLERDGQVCLWVQRGASGEVTDPRPPAGASSHSRDQNPAQGQSTAGLGLSLSRAIAEQHGGSLTVSDRRGRGLRVELRLPLDSYGTFGGRVESSDHGVRRAVTASERRLAERCARGRVVVIDADADIRDSLLALFDSEGYACDVHDSVASYLREQDGGRIDFPGPRCLLRDAALAESDSVEWQRRLAEPDAIPVLLMGSAGSAPEAVSALRGGVLDFLLKPVEAEILLNAVARALSVSAERQRQRARHRELQSRFGLLTHRERDIASRVAFGQRNPEIAAALGIALRTVKRHRQQVMEKLEVESLVELVRLVDEAVGAGLLDG